MSDYYIRNLTNVLVCFFEWVIGEQKKRTWVGLLDPVMLY